MIGRLEDKIIGATSDYRITSKDIQRSSQYGIKKGSKKGILNQNINTSGKNLNYGKTTKFSKIVRSLDFLGRPFEFRYGNSKTFKTKIGGCISTCIILAVAFAVWVIMSTLFDTGNPEVSSTKELNEYTPKMDLIAEQFFIATGTYKVKLPDGTFNIIQEDEALKYMTPVAYII